MRLDKFLKVSRIIKRRTIAKSVSELGLIKINGKIAKPSSIIHLGDQLELNLGDRILIVKVKNINITANKQSASEMFEIIEDRVIDTPFNS